MRAEGVEGELLVVLLVALRLLEGYGADCERKGRLIQTLIYLLLGYIVINRHFLFVIIELGNNNISRFTLTIYLSKIK
jgi:hypothetical protein